MKVMGIEGIGEEREPYGGREGEMGEKEGGRL